MHQKRVLNFFLILQLKSLLMFQLIYIQTKNETVYL